MSSVQTTNPFEALGLAQPAVTRAAKNKLGQEDFLKLMTTQLKNQDPLKPLESNEFLGQIAQFSTVSGIQDLQNSFSQLASSMQANQTLQAAALIGRSVLVPSAIGALEAGGSLSGVAGLPSSTTQLDVSIYDSNGQLVRRLNLGAQQSGVVQFSWDGLRDDGQAASPGRYAIKAEALLDGKSTALGTLVQARVESVALGAEGLVISLAGLGAVSLADIEQIL
ncbi:MAG: flagellar hook assembly protein FlgD [Gammaproteobacteria bacterium]|nr:MAG: flagellar hook assembly protein FlgD [Gammaproteobacteria bacterium]